MLVKKRVWFLSWATLALVSTPYSLGLSPHLGLGAKPNSAQASTPSWTTLSPQGQESSLAVGLYLADAAFPETSTPSLVDLQVAWSVDKTRNTCPAHAEGWTKMVRAQLPTQLPRPQLNSEVTLQHQMAQVFSATLRQSTFQAIPQVDVTAQDRAPLAHQNVSELWHVWQQLYAQVEHIPDQQDEQAYLWVQGQRILQHSDRIWVDAFAESLRAVLRQDSFEPERIIPTQLDKRPAIRIGHYLVLHFDQEMALAEDEHLDLLVIEWVNNLREALGAQVLELAEAQMLMYGITETQEVLAGTASWYGPYFHGRLTANGEIYDQEAFTAAHPSLPFGTYLKITNLENDVSAILRINDRGPYIAPRTLDLSRGVARCIRSKDSGVVPYEAVIMTAS